MTTKRWWSEAEGEQRDGSAGDPLPTGLPHKLGAEMGLAFVPWALPLWHNQEQDPELLLWPRSEHVMGDERGNSSKEIK